tara:strand:- start:531 stop:662 length:132 start_codon:yes stop_codon:yes gene_type:complete
VNFSETVNGGKNLNNNAGKRLQTSQAKTLHHGGEHLLRNTSNN